VTTLVLGPIGFLVWKGFVEAPPSDTWQQARLLDLPSVIGRVTLLASLTTAWAVLLGVSLAWLAVRSDLPGRYVLRWLAPLPLTIPPYVGAVVYQILLAPRGAANRWLAGALGQPPEQVRVFDVYGVTGAAFVLGLFTYPYVFLLVSGALEQSSPGLEEVARTSGLTPGQVFRRVTLPLMRPALLAGALVVFLYGWADFGVVSLLRVRTLTTLIYDYVQGTMDWAVPAALSVLLTVITVAVLVAQTRALGRRAYTQITGGARPWRPVPVGAWRWAATLWAAGVLTLGLVIPLATLGARASELGWARLAALLLAESPAVVRSLWTSLAGATLALGLALAASWLDARRGQRITTVFQVGYAVPGTVLGLGMVGFFHAVLPWVYATPLVLVLGYVVLYITPACQAARAALAQLDVSIEEAASTLGRPPWWIFCRVTVPLIAPGLLSGWMLVFVLSMRELAATLIVRPPGFDTLAVRLWLYTLDVGPEARASALAILLVALLAVPWLVLLHRWGRRDTALGQAVA
jgi:iron(III) transport system permease protein